MMLLGKKCRLVAIGFFFNFFFNLHFFADVTNQGYITSVTQARALYHLQKLSYFYLFAFQSLKFCTTKY